MLDYHTGQRMGSYRDAVKFSIPLLTPVCKPSGGLASISESSACIQIVYCLSK